MARRFFLLIFLLACADDAHPADGGVDASRPDAFADALPPDLAREDLGLDLAAPDSGSDRGIDAGDGLRPVYPLMARHPEGGVFDERGRFFVGSLSDGTVHAVDAASGEETLLFPGEKEGVWWTLGMDVDEARNRLWVCAMEDLRGTDRAPPYDGYVWIFDTESGARLQVVDLAVVDEAATCTDVVVGADGTGYIVDRESGNIYSLVEGEAPELFLNDRLLEGGLAGQNGAVIDEERGLLFVVVYQPPRLVRIPLEGGRVREVNIEGEFNDIGPIGAGADGLGRDADGSLLVAFTSKLMRLEATTDDWMNARLVSMDVSPTMTDVVVARDAVYLLNGQSLEFAFGVEPQPFELLRIVPPRID